MQINLLYVRQFDSGRKVSALLLHLQVLHLQSSPYRVIDMKNTRGEYYRKEKVTFEDDLNVVEILALCASTYGFYNREQILS